MNKATQKNTILRHLIEIGPITSLQAVLQYNILRPSNRVQELKAEGLDIGTEIIYKRRDDGSTTHYAKYTYMGA